MQDQSQDKLDRLLKEAFPFVEVSPDFTLRLWRRLMKGATRPPWMLPVPVLGLAAAVGIVTGIWTWGVLGPLKTDPSMTSPLRQVARWDLFGNAPLDTIAGSYLKLMQEGDKA